MDDKKFIRTLARKIFTVYERAPDVNVMGRSHRGCLSPKKRRFDMLCKEARPYLSSRQDERGRMTLIRNVIDTTNRNFREELRQRKGRREGLVKPKEAKTALDVEEPAPAVPEPGIATNQVPALPALATNQVPATLATNQVQALPALATQQVPASTIATNTVTAPLMTVNQLPGPLVLSHPLPGPVGGVDQVQAPVVPVNKLANQVPPYTVASPVAPVTPITHVRYMSPYQVPGHLPNHTLG